MTHRARVNVRKVISLLTATTILFCNTGFTIYSEQETEQEPVTVLHEDVSLRGEYEKHFVMSDGTYLAVAYPDQIHYEENGEWKDINNTLVYNSSADRYVNTSSGDFSASFASTAGTAKTVKLEEDEYELSWRVRLPNTAEKLIATTDNLAAAGLTRQQAAQLSTARVEIQAKAAALAEMDENERAISTENTASQIVYPNLLGNGIDVRYTLSPYAVEEDVVLHNRVYSFTGYEAVYSRNGLTAVHNEEENTVLFYDKNGNIRFTVNPPSMYDSADAVSTDIELTVTNTASEIIIKVEPNTTWLGSADRVYPVVIDPTSHTYSSSTNIDDTYVKITETSGTNLHYSEDRFRFGMYDGVQTYGFLRHRSLPLIPANAYISSAYCNIYQVPSQTVVRFNVGIMTAPWSESTINASNIPSYTTLQTNLSYSGDSTSNRYKQINVTDITRQGYAEYNATGNMSYYGLGFSTAEPTVADWNAVCSSTYATASKRPTLTISYTLYEDAGLSNGIYRMQNTSSGKYIDSTNTLGVANEAAVAGQFWKIIPRGNNTYSIHPYSNQNLALTLTSSFTANNGQMALTAYSSTNTYQRWSIINSNGVQVIRPSFYCDKLLRPSTSNGLETYYAASTSTSGWNIDEVTMPAILTPGLSPGMYCCVRNASSNLVMDVYNADNSDGTPLIQYPLSGATNQRFLFYYTGEGKYKILVDHTSDNKVLTANTDGSVYIGTDTNAAYQKWYIVMFENYYYFVNAAFPSKKLTALSSSPCTLVLCESPSSGYLWDIGAENMNISNDAYTAGVRLTYINNSYFFDYTIPVDSMLNNCVSMCEENRCLNEDQYYYIMGPKISITEFYAQQIDSFMWFYGQVNHGAVWDIKLKNRWEDALPDVPYIAQDYVFIFRGEETTAEDLGNIMYGYLGRATGFGDVTLYWGGGVARQGSMNNNAVITPPDYGDDPNDHICIERGYNMFLSDYPDYPDIGFNGIPVKPGLIAAIGDLVLDLAV